MKGTSRMKLEKDSRKFIETVYRIFGNDVRKIRVFNDLVLKYNNGKMQLLDFQMKLVDMLKDYSELIDYFNRLVPDDFRVPVQDSEPNLEEVSKKCIAKLKNRPEDLEALINILRDVKERGRQVGEEVGAKLDLILKDEPEMRDAIKNHLNRDQKRDSTSLGEAPGSKEANQLNQLNEIDDYKTPSAAYRARINRDRGAAARGSLNRRVEEKPVPVASTQPIVAMVSLPPAIKTEHLLFEVMMKNLTPNQYEEFTKCIALFVEMIISASELFELTKGLFKDEKYFAFFQEIINSREPTRRKTANLFKPSSEFDFSNCQRMASYTKAPENYSLLKAVKNNNPIINEEINHTWLSVPHGSEQSSFTLMRKNTFEEALFKVEEERYEYDNKIQIFTFAVTWLEQILNEETPPDKINYLIERVIKLKIVQKIYDDSHEVTELLRKNTKMAGKVVLDRVKSKLSEIKNIKHNIQKGVWADIAEKNFHRSLDHRSFSFKHFEKKLTNPKFFIEDANQRYNNLQKPIPDADVSKYWQLLNTFEGISNDAICQHRQLKVSELESAQKLQVSMRKKCPIYRMGFENEQIRRDISEILWFGILNFHSNYSEKEKIKRTFKGLLVDILGFDYSRETNLYDHIISEEKFLFVVSRIESKIYDKSFSFFRHSEPEQEIIKNASGETIYTVIEEINNKKSNSPEQNNEDGNNKTKGVKEAKPKANGNAADKKDDDSSNEQKANSGSNPGSDQEEEEELVKEMEYLETSDKTIFLPAKTPTSKLLYGTKHFLNVFRMFFTLYERFLRAWEIANTFEVNSKTEHLTKEEKAHLTNERYDTFKWILVQLIRANIESMKYEDFIRSLFGKDAYSLVYVDKIVNLTIKALQNLANDDLSVKALNLYLNSIGKRSEKEIAKDKKHMEIESPPSKAWQEELYISKVNQLALFLLDGGILNVNLYEVPYRGWNEEEINSTTDYLQRHAAHIPSIEYVSNSKIFLKRNKLLVNKHSEKNPNQKVKRVYMIEYKTTTNSFKIITDSYCQEDLVLRTPRVKLSDSDRFDMEYKRVKKFKDVQKKLLTIATK